MKVKAKDLRRMILSDYPDYYKQTDFVKIRIVGEFVVNEDIEVMYKYMEQKPIMSM